MLVNRAANDYEDKKQKRQNKSGQYGPSVYHQEPNTSNMDYLYRNQYPSQPYNGAEYPQCVPPHEYRPYHGPPMGHTQHQGQSRSIEGSQMYYPTPENLAPPPYGEPHPTKAQRHFKPGPAQEYYSQSSI